LEIIIIIRINICLTPNQSENHYGVWYDHVWENNECQSSIACLPMTQKICQMTDIGERDERERERERVMMMIRQIF